MVYPWRSVSQDPVNEPLSGASASNITSDTPPTMLVQAEDASKSIYCPPPLATDNLFENADGILSATLGT